MSGSVSRLEPSNCSWSTKMTGVERFAPVVRSLQVSNFKEPLTAICLPLRT